VTGVIRPGGFTVKVGEVEPSEYADSPPENKVNAHIHPADPATDAPFHEVVMGEYAHPSCVHLMNGRYHPIPENDHARGPGSRWTGSMRTGIEAERGWVGDAGLRTRGRGRMRGRGPGQAGRTRGRDGCAASTGAIFRSRTLAAASRMNPDLRFS